MSCFRGFPYGHLEGVTSIQNWQQSCIENTGRQLMMVQDRFILDFVMLVSTRVVSFVWKRILTIKYILWKKQQHYKISSNLSESVQQTSNLPTTTDPSFPAFSKLPWMLCTVRVTLSLAQVASSANSWIDFALRPNRQTELSLSTLKFQIIIQWSEGYYHTLPTVLYPPIFTVIS